MATEPNIRNLFPADDTPIKALDAGAIIRRSRARRLPKRLAVGGITTLAVAGIVVASVQGFGTTANISASSQQSEATTAQEPAEQGSADSPMSATEAGGADLSSKRAPAVSINQCGGTIAELDLPSSDLELSLDFPKTATLDGKEISGTVTLTNTGDETLSGHLQQNHPAITLSQDGVVLWHSNFTAEDSMMHYPEPLAPGQSVEYTTTFWPVTCTVEDETADPDADIDYGTWGQFLPEVDPGEYQLSALMDFETTDDVELVASPTSTITLK